MFSPFLDGDMLPDPNPPLKITDDELDRAVIGQLPVSRPVVRRPEADREVIRLWNGVAIASVLAGCSGPCITAALVVVAGGGGAVVVFGVLAGILAIVLGCTALARPSRAKRRGSGLAVAGIVLGVGCATVWPAVWSTDLAEGGALSNLAVAEPDPETLERLPPPIRRAMKANVLIEGQSGWMGLRGQTTGSGVILKIAEGTAYVVTNRHVVDQDFSGANPVTARGKVAAGIVTVKLVGQDPEPARVVWMAPGGIDLAVAAVPCRQGTAEAALWAADSDVKIGDEVFAVGNPHGLGWTHTTGAVSQFRRQELRGRTVQVIQTNTAINPGNSGGGLYDKEGRLVGITTWTQDKRVAEGLSFAIAFETLLKLNPEVLKLGAADSP
jgi:S1-C subfamily serine protease